VKNALTAQEAINCARKSIYAVFEYFAILGTTANAYPTSPASGKRSKPWKEFIANAFRLSGRRYIITY